MRGEQLYGIILMLVLVLTVAGRAGVQAPGKLDLGVKDTRSIVTGEQPAQPERPPETHLVRSRFEPGPSDRELTLVFDVSPTPQAPPVVRRLGATPHDDAETLAVRRDPTGRYSAVLANVPPVADGRVLIELSDPGAGTFELHGADFALREHVADRPSSRPSRDGRFVVFTKPEGISPGARLLIGSGERPTEDLPPAVTSKAVLAVYSLDFLPASDSGDGWLLTMAVTATDAKPVLFYLPKGGAVWKVLDSTALEEHSLLAARVAGPGTYLLAKEATP
jgi:hypothetical protein